MKCVVLTCLVCNLQCLQSLQRWTKECKALIRVVFHIYLHNKPRWFIQALRSFEQGKQNHLFIQIRTSFVFPKQTEIHGGGHRGRQDPLAPPESPQTPVSRRIPSSTRALHIPAGNSPPMRHRLILIKLFSAHLQLICSWMWFRAQCQGISRAASQRPTENREFLHSGITLI